MKDSALKAESESTEHPRLNIGLALGSGSARGWAHIGVIRALAELGIEPQIIAGSSIGAFVGAAYASNELDRFENWVCSLSWKEILDYLDLSIGGGGVIQGDKLLSDLPDVLRSASIESLSCRFGTVATELNTGREVWFREGPLIEGVRASIGLPGLFAPVFLNGRWLVDGGLTNPVPVSLCRAMGAEVVIAVNLNGDIVGKHQRKREAKYEKSRLLKEQSDGQFMESITSLLKNRLQDRKAALWSQLFGKSQQAPGLFEVMASSINIMQNHITRSRMAGDPPDVIISPRLSQLGLLEFDKADRAIAEGRASVERLQSSLEELLVEL